ncbi:MAG: protein kinase [Muribaculaceae bacterium]|nr:protein kinase [Muribaculaceae bacterium]
MSAAEEKWTEVEHLPKWDEEFYEVYTAKKHGKWVMLKRLRPSFNSDEEKVRMMESEFDTRYNLAHPNIVMVNDFEDVPGLGRCIITDDVYGTSLRQLIDDHAVTGEHLKKLATSLVSAMRYIQENHIVHHPLRPERIIFTENIGNLKLIDVGFEQRPALSPHDTAEDIYNYGVIMLEALGASSEPNPVLRRVAERCTHPDVNRRYRSIEQLQLALDSGGKTRLYTIIITILSILLVVMAYLLTHPHFSN